MRRHTRCNHVRHISAVQIEFERVMFGESYANEFDRLKALAESYKAGRITAAVYVHGLFWLFADDGCYEWLDDAASLMKLTEAIINVSEIVSKPVINDAIGD